MVALLWADGNTEGAIQLENLCNKLARAYSFDLRCAYPIQGFSRQQMAEPLLRVCAEHTGIVHDGVRRELPRGEFDLHRSDVLTQRDYDPETFRLFVAAVRDYAIFLLDTAGRVKSWNAGAERIKGYRSSEIIGKHFSAFYLDEDVRSGKPQRLLDQAVKDGHVEDEGWRVRKDGSKFWASVTITPVRDATGKLIGFGKVTRDLTERRRRGTGPPPH